MHSQNTRTGIDSMRVQEASVASLTERLAELSERQLALIQRFIDQILEVHDPDVVETFVRWKEEPVLDTLLLLAAKLDGEQQDHLLECAEQLLVERSGPALQTMGRSR